VRRIDRLVLGEMAGPWAFGVVIFTVLVTAGSFLFQLTDYLAKGAPLLQVGMLASLLLPGIAAKTFPMAVLLSALLSFGRLSGDSEVVAAKSAGYSVARLMAPVAAFGLAVSLFSFAFGEAVVPWSARRAVELRADMDQAQQGSALQPTSRPVFEEGRIQAFVVAKDFSFARRRLTGVSVVAYDDSGAPSFYLEADALRFQDESDWQIEGRARLVPADGGAVATFRDGLWPKEVPRLSATPTDFLTQTLRDLDALSMAEMGRQVRQEARNPARDPAHLANLEFGYWNKVSVPLGALVFGLVGAPLGIRGHRSGTATGFWLAVVIIFAYMLLVNVLAILAQGGLFPSYVASFGPTVVGLAVGAFLVWRRSQ
jgi:lipopolysaccharide export system permease protein